MDILIINSEYPPIGGGASHASRNIAEMMVSRGHTVRIITARHRDLPAKEILGGVEIHRVFTAKRKIDRSGPFEQGLFMLTGSLKAIQLCRTICPDAALAFFGIPGGAVARVLHLTKRIPYIVSLRGGDVPGFRPYDFGAYHFLMAPLIRSVWKHASGVVANSHGLKLLATRFYPAIPVDIIPNGVQANLYQPAQPGGKNRLLFASRLTHQKGLDILLKALATLQPLEWHLTIAGDGPRRADWESLSHSLGLQQRVDFVGWVDDEQLRKNYDAADIFVLPSRHEGMPNVVLEAMACGLPVIATGIAGSEELVVDGQTGFLVPVDDPSALAAALKTLLTDPRRVQSMGQAGRERVVASYTWEAVTDSYLSRLEKKAGQ
jgi:glycosyltransferase involved in cell wall biosynthesis